MSTIAVIGAGSWGTAISIALARNGHTVRLTTRNPKHVEALRLDRENKRYLPGIPLDPRIIIAENDEEAIPGADLTVFAAPAQHFREALESAAPFLESGDRIVNVSKGIELGTLLRMSEIAHILRRDLIFTALSGPSHAEEVCRALPTTLVAASENVEAAKYVQDIFMSDRLRVYTSDDVTGVEIGGALKNIIALGAGISDGIGFGANAKAALMTRGITEMSRLGTALGAKAETFAGLTGVGDLIVTCTSLHSRNLRCGILIGQGVPPEKAVEKVGMVVEGFYTTDAAYTLARRKNVEMPITSSIYRCLHGEVGPEEAVRQLMMRPAKPEETV
ncbi:MAG: NAD(P)-dependent glycerol-3-phosphate dehydrogenase [Eubacteriales bacterium]|nr:NAD(P)-dependent glycerol-3-phosphate dehydrogenase [Eubacteriales bacterium]